MARKPYVPKKEFAVDDVVRVISVTRENNRAAYVERMEQWKGKLAIVLPFDRYCHARMEIVSLRIKDVYGLVEDQIYMMKEDIRRVYKAMPRIVPEAPKKLQHILQSEAEQKMLETLRESVAKYGVGTCSYAKLLEDGSVADHQGDICHARIGAERRYGPYIPAIALNVSGHLKGKTEEFVAQYKKYVKYIIEDSPWKSCFKLGEGGITSVYDSGVLLNVEHSIGQLAGAAVALREGSEFPWKIPLFDKLLDKGFSGNVAYLLSNGVKLDYADNYTVIGLDGNHKSLNGDAKFANFMNFFANGFPKGEKSYVEEHQGYHGISRHAVGVFEHQPYGTERLNTFNAFLTNSLQKPKGAVAFNAPRVADYITFDKICEVAAQLEIEIAKAKK